MRARLSFPAVIAIALLAAFTIFITWRAKKLEAAIGERRDEPDIINKAAPAFALPAIEEAV